MSQRAPNSHKLMRHVFLALVVLALAPLGQSSGAEGTPTFIRSQRIQWGMPWSETLPAWRGEVRATNRSCTVLYVNSHGQTNPVTLTRIYVPATRCYGIGLHEGRRFAFENGVASLRMDRSLYLAGSIATNKVPAGADVDTFLEQKERDYLDNFSLRPPGDVSVRVYVGCYLGEGEIVRDPQTGTVLAVKHLGTGAPAEMFFVKGDGTNAIVQARVSGVDALIKLDEQLNPVAATRGGKPVVVTPENNTCFAPKLWGPATAGFRLAVSFDKNTFTNGEPITGIARLQNVTTDNLIFEHDLPPTRRVVVTSEGGEVLRPRTPPETPGQRAPFFSPHYITVAPDEESTFPISVTDEYDMSSPGRYGVNFCLKVFRFDDPYILAEVTSGKVPIKVLPK
jgi:hypothetical protein